MKAASALPIVCAIVFLPLVSVLASGQAVRSKTANPKQQPIGSFGFLRNEELGFSLTGGGQGGGAGVVGGVPCEVPAEGFLGCGDTADGVLSEEDSTLDDGRFFDVWHISVEDAVLVTVELSSDEDSDPDTYLYVLSSSCNIIAYNDDCTPWNYDLSCVTALLPPGDHYAVVTGFSPGETGSYQLAVGCDRPPCGDCRVDSISCGETFLTQLASGDCELRGRGYLRTVSLSLDQDKLVTINLASAPSSDPDTFLFVTDDVCAEVVAENDDASPGDYDRSSVTTWLRAGNYSIWITSFGPGEEGAVTLSVECSQTPEIPATTPSGVLVLILGLVVIDCLVGRRRRGEPRLLGG